jgi:hypothetical protein
MTDYTRYSYKPVENRIHVSVVQPNGETRYLFGCDEVCQDDVCIGSDELTREREVSARDVNVSRLRDGTDIVELVDVAVERHA